MFLSAFGLAQSAVASDIEQLRGIAAVQEGQLSRLGNMPRYLSHTDLPVNFSASLGASWQSVQTGIHITFI